MVNVVSIDTEHSANIFNPWEKGFYLTCVGLTSNYLDDVVVWFNHAEQEPTAEPLTVIGDYLEGADLIVAHNLKHDMNVLRYIGVNFNHCKLWCTMVSDYLLEGQQKIGYNLNAMCDRYGMPAKLDEVAKMWEAGIDTYDVPAELLHTYVLDDARKALEIQSMQQHRAEKQRQVQLLALQNEFIHGLSDIESNGIKFDVDIAHNLIDEYAERVGNIESNLKDLLEEPRLNLGSSQQLSAALFGGTTKLSHKEWVITEYKTQPYSIYREKDIIEEATLDGAGFTPPKQTETKTKGVYSTDKSVLQRLVCRSKEQREIKKLLLDRSADAKVLEMLKGKRSDSGIINKVQEDEKVHPRMNQAVTATGRLSSSNPNGQNLFPIVKRCFVPEFDYICQWDLSQIEWRAAAWLSQDQNMMYEINHGVDQHSAACVDLMEMELNKQNRTYAKIFNFRMIYGGVAYGFFMDHKMPSFNIKKWKAIVDSFYKKYYGLEEWQTKNIRSVLESGRLQLPTGRLFIFNKSKYEDGLYTYNDRHVKNYPVQGIAGGDILPLVMVIIRRGLLKYKLSAKIILTVHDSIVFDVPAGERVMLYRLCKKVTETLPMYLSMTFGLNWNVNLEGEWEEGKTYGSMKEVKYD